MEATIDPSQGPGVGCYSSEGFVFILRPRLKDGHVADALEKTAVTVCLRGADASLCPLQSLWLVIPTSLAKLVNQGTRRRKVLAKNPRAGSDRRAVCSGRQGMGRLGNVFLSGFLSGRRVGS